MSNRQAGADMPEFSYDERLTSAVTDILWDFEGRGTLGNARDAALAILGLLGPFLRQDLGEDEYRALERIVEARDGIS